MIYNAQDEIYVFLGIRFESLKHLDEIGLISFATPPGCSLLKESQRRMASYFGNKFTIEYPKTDGNSMNIGLVLLSKAGQELAPICGSEPVKGFMEYVIQGWQSNGIKVMEHDTE